MASTAGHLNLALFLLQKTGKRVGTLHAHLNSQQNVKLWENFENPDSI